VNKSETIGKLAEALSKAQGEMKGALKDAENPFFKSRYADLASVWEACRGPLSRNGLAVVQVPEVKDGKVIICTVMIHSSGEWISGDLDMTPTKSDPQGVGSAITYGRRYGLSAFAGIAAEDDDGNAASAKTAVTQAPVVFQKKPAQVMKEALIDTRQPELPVEESLPTEEDGYINLSEQRAIGRQFREALPPHLNSDDSAKALLHSWLVTSGFYTTIGEPPNQVRKGTTKKIEKHLFEEVKARAILYARKCV
jgi:hypothetical protein